ncbi:MAG: glycosyltransferase family 9 protein [Flavobacteriales bacterium]|nr:glycosyltransferase family 9 protein [Flavobacteriales bacterium]
MKIGEVKYNCKHFEGDIPCKPNKLHNVQCNNCSHYEQDINAIIQLNTKEETLQEIYKICNFSNSKTNEEKTNTETQKTKILFIKLGAIGDVIRTTPLLEKYKDKYGDCHFTWITHSPQVVPKTEVDLILKWNESSVSYVSNQEFDIAINLDKDKEACMLLSLANSTEKFGFTWKNGHLNIATNNAEHKLITGLFDHISKTNTKNYLEEIFEICHFDFNGEEYMINLNQKLSDDWKVKLGKLANGKTIIGLNTGCGLRWKTRLWPSEYWVELIKNLEQQGYFCLLMGGPEEDEMNKFYESGTNATYLGTFSLEEFISITNNTDIIVTPVSMMMHIALALKKQLMLFHNIFNVHEFELYGRGIIIEPTSGCDCYFGNSCSREKSCMKDISVKDVLSNIAELNKNLKK